MAERGWTEIEIRVTDDLADLISNRLVEQGANGVVLRDNDYFWDEGGNLQKGEEGITLVKSYFPTDSMLDVRSQLERYLTDLSAGHPGHPRPELHVRDMPDEDWAHSWRRFFKPTKIGSNVVVKPTWEDYTPKAGEMVIELDPGMAFGTGQHATTKLVIDAIQRYATREDLFGARAIAHNALDLGTGSGILAILCAKLGIARTVAVDNDPVACEAAEENVKINGVAEKVQVRCVEIDKIAESFDLIAANILAETLIDMREEIVERLNSKGVLILSGILKQSGADVKREFMKSKLDFVESINDEDWTALIFTKT